MSKPDVAQAPVIPTPGLKDRKIKSLRSLSPTTLILEGDLSHSRVYLKNQQQKMENIWITVTLNMLSDPHKTQVQGRKGH